MRATTVTKMVGDMVKTEDGDRECPLPLSVIPNYMGINLCSVESLSWTRREDKQLVDLTIHFIPADKEKRGDDPSFEHFRARIEFVRLRCPKLATLLRGLDEALIEAPLREIESLLGAG